MIAVALMKNALADSNLISDKGPDTIIREIVPSIATRPTRVTWLSPNSRR